MSDGHIGRWKTASWVMRGCFILTLVVVCAICISFYIEQDQQNRQYNQVRALATQFNKTNVVMQVLAEKAARIGAETPPKVFNPFLDQLLRGKTIKQRREILAGQPVDPDIIPFKQTLTYYQNKANTELGVLSDLWQAATPELTAAVATPSRYMKVGDPFKDHRTMLLSEKIKISRSKADVHWAAREIFGIFNIVLISNQQAIATLQEFESTLAKSQGTLLENFLLLTLGALAFLAAVVFLPVDIFIQRMMRQVIEKTKLANRGKERLKILADINADWLWEMDKDLKFSYFSESFEQITGVVPKMLIGKTRKQSGVPGATPEDFKEHLRQLDDHEAFRDFLHSRTKSDGSTVWLSISGSPTFDDNNQFNGYLGAGQDVTENIMQQHELEEAHRVAKSADQAKSEFLANMSHEIRTPMNGVMGMAELLIRTELDPKQKTFADIIVKSGASLLTIINDILDFSKIGAGQMELDPAPFKLAEAIEDVATLVSSKVAEKDLELAVRIAPDLPEMYLGDVGRLRQIVTNLLGNAVKFTEKGHVFVDVNGHSDGEGNTKLSFRIEDTGIGIPREKCNRIFEKFSQVDGSATRKHEGTGLGLAIASSLVKLMDGEIGVESRVGKGSVFWFEVSLPVHGEARKKQRIPVDVSGARLLVVDDNEVNRSILSEQMAAWRFDAAAAASGEEALAVLRAAAKQNIAIKAVVLDYHMPMMNGGDVARAMQADPELSDIPIIMLTSVDQTEEGRAFSSLGVQGHLIKPARSSVLLETVIRVIQDSDGANVNYAGIAIAKSLGASNPAPVEQMAENSKSSRAMERSPQTREIDVLVVEDNEVNQIVFTQILQGTGYTFLIANNGEEALTLYERHKPKIICMDVSMPVMNGLEATREIRKREHETGFHTPIIGVTAHAIKGDMEKCFDAGMDDYLSKPVSPDRFEEKIDLWLKRGKAAKKSA